MDAGIGALILFAIVQLLIIFSAILNKEKLSLQKGFGIVLAFSGLIYLLYPDEQIELSIYHVLLMVLSGIGWGGFYTILGKSCKDALLHTTDNFTKSILFIFIFYFLFVENTFISSNGILLAFLSGGITSAIGYVLWYYILPQIQIVTSGIIQLIVPPIAIFLGVILLDEDFSLKLFLATSTILVGIAITILSRKKI